MPEPSERRSPDVHDALLATAQRLLGTSGDPPTETDLRRAISTAYYALFHALSRLVVDLAFSQLDPSEPDWVKAYRGLVHKETKRRCNVINLRAQTFPEPVPRIGADFCKLHEARERADYVPDAEFTSESATMLVEAARDALRRLAELDSATRHRFAAYLEQQPRK